MQDVGKPGRILEILNTESTLISDFGARPKLCFGFKELKESYNTNVQCSDYYSSVREYDSVGRPLLRRTAVVPVKVALTRFAGAESMLRAFIRSNAVYRTLVDSADFSSKLFETRNETKRVFFESAVRDDTHLERCVDIYHILRLMRRYLRIFDDESFALSEVFPASLQLEEKLPGLPLTAFYTAERKQEGLEVLLPRLTGLGRCIALLSPIHYVAYYLDIRSVNSEICEKHQEMILNYMETFVNSSAFPPLKTLASDGGVSGALQRLFEDFLFLRMSGTTQAENPTLWNVLLAYRSVPVGFWIPHKKRLILRALALRVLSVGPSSSRVERSSSACQAM